MLNLSQTVPPGATPVEMATLKEHLRITSSDEDSYLATVLLPGAAMAVERSIKQALITQTWRWLWDEGFPATGRLRVPLGPLQSVTEIGYYDTNGDAQVVASTDYNVDGSGPRGRVWLATGVAWPSVQADRPGVAWLDFVCGFGGTPEDVPVPVRHLVLLTAAHFYAHREPAVVGTIVSAVPMHLAALAEQWTVREFEHAP